MSIKAGEKIINGNMIKRNEDFKNKRTKRKKDSISHKGYISTVGEGGGRHIGKKNLEKQNNFFFLISKILKILIRGGGGGVA